MQRPWGSTEAIQCRSGMESLCLGGRQGTGSNRTWALAQGGGSHGGQRREDQTRYSWHLLLLQGTSSWVSMGFVRLLRHSGDSGLLCAPFENGAQSGSPASGLIRSLTS